MGHCRDPDIKIAFCVIIKHYIDGIIIIISIIFWRHDNKSDYIRKQLKQ